MKRLLFAVGVAALLTSVSAGALAQVSSSTQCIASAYANGTADAITIPALPCALTTNLLILSTTQTNVTTTPTLQPLGLPAQVIIRSNGNPVQAGDLVAGGKALLNPTGTQWVLLNPANATGGSGSINGAPAGYMAYYATTGNILSGTPLVGVANGGTGTSTPSLVAGTNVTVTGTWPNQTVNATSNLGALSVKSYNASGSEQSTTGNCAGTTTLPLAAAIDFVNGQGIRLNHCGPNFILPSPTAASVSVTGTAGSTTYTYTVASLDTIGGVGAAISNVTTSTGNAILSSTNYNTVNWTSATGVEAYAVYGRIGGSLTFLGITKGNSWKDIGGAAMTKPDYLPATPQGASLPSALITTISSGGGTTTLTLAAAATQTLVGADIRHDDSAAIQTTINAASTSVKSVLVPASSGCYLVSSPITLPSSTAVSILGQGRAASCFKAATPYNAMIDKDTTFMLGGGIYSMSFYGSGLVSRNIRFLGGAQVTLADLDLFDTTNQENLLLGPSTINFAVSNSYLVAGNPGTNPSGDNCLSPSCLPFVNLEVQGVNSQFTNIIAANATFSNIEDGSSAAGNHYLNVHGYDYPVSLLGQYNIAMNGFQSTASGFEGDGGSIADAGIGGNSNTFTAAALQFAGVPATVGINNGGSNSGNVVTGNVIYGTTLGNGVSGVLTNNLFCNNFVSGSSTGLATNSVNCN